MDKMRNFGDSDGEWNFRRKLRKVFYRVGHLSAFVLVPRRKSEAELKVKKEKFVF